MTNEESKKYWQKVRLEQQSVLVPSAVVGGFLGFKMNKCCNLSPEFGILNGAIAGLFISSYIYITAKNEKTYNENYKERLEKLKNNRNTNYLGV